MNAGERQSMKMLAWVEPVKISKIFYDKINFKQLQTYVPV